MIEIDEYTFARKYSLSPSDFEDVDVTALPFSVRVINCFLSNKIHTMAELLQLTPSKMLSIRNFGRTSLREIEEYFEKVSGGSVAPKHDLPVHTTFKLVRHADEIAMGDFSFADKLPLSEAEQRIVDAYREAYECLGDELVLDV